MAIRVLCPNLKCRAILCAPEQARGKSVRCRMCGTRVRIPAGAAGSGGGVKMENGMKADGGDRPAAGGDAIARP